MREPPPFPASFRPRPSPPKGRAGRDRARGAEGNRPSSADRRRRERAGRAASPSRSERPHDLRAVVEGDAAVERGAGARRFETGLVEGDKGRSGKRGDFAFGGRRERRRRFFEWKKAGARRRDDRHGPARPPPDPGRRAKQRPLFPLPLEETLQNVPARSAASRAREEVGHEPRAQRLGVRFPLLRRAPAKRLAHVVLQPKGCGFSPQPPVFLVLSRASSSATIIRSAVRSSARAGSSPRLREPSTDDRPAPDGARPPCRRGRAVSESSRPRT